MASSPARPSREVGDKYESDLIGADALASYGAAIDEAKAAIAASRALNRVCHLRRGDVRGADYMTSMFTDALIPGWDLAKATEQDSTLDPGLVEVCYALVQARQKRFRTSPAFGQGRVDDPGDTASSKERMLWIFGREADW